MFIFIKAFLLGTASGLRALIGLAAVSWAVHSALADPLSATELRRAWAEVNDKLTRAFEGFTLEDWLQKHTAVSDEDFIKDPLRNRLAVVMNRTSHPSYHVGQAVLTK